MNFGIEWTERAARDLKKLEPLLQKRIFRKINEFAEEGSFHGIRRVTGYDNLYRLRIGDYRALFEFKDDVVNIIKVGHRKNIY